MGAYLKDRLVFFLITATFIIDNIYNAFEGITGRFIHLNGTAGYNMDWGIWILCNNVNIIIFASIPLLKNNSAPWNKAAIWSYVLWALYNLGEYITFGVRHNSYHWTEIGYFITVFLLYTRFKNNGVSA